MSSIKKTTTKSIKSPTPANKAAKPATKTAAKSSGKSSPQTEASATASIVAAVARAAAPAVLESPAAPAAESAAAKAVAITPATTTITARVDVGFGNSLYVRGDGPGLSWSYGVLMTCIGRDVWQARLAGESDAGFTFKFLINDITWSTGVDYKISTGANQTFVPKFS